jgi:hypothetical protein
MERVNDILAQAGSKATERNSYKDLRYSPTIVRRSEAIPRPKLKRPIEKPEKPKKGAKLKVELGSYKLKDVFRSHLRSSFSALKADTAVVLDPLEAKVGRILESMGPSLQQPVAMTRCSHCSQTGLTLLTSSTQDELSPRFFEKMKWILPKGSSSRAQGFALSKPESNLNLPDISYIEPFVSSDRQDDFFEDRGRVQLEAEEVSFDMISDSTHLKTPFFEKENYSQDTTLRIPKLNISDIVTPLQAFTRSKPLANAKKPTSSPQLGRKNGKIFRGLDAVESVFTARLRRAFDMIFLSRVHVNYSIGLTKDDFGESFIRSSSLCDSKTSEASYRSRPPLSCLESEATLKHLPYKSAAICHPQGVVRRQGESKTSRVPLSPVLYDVNCSMDKPGSRRLQAISFRMASKILWKRLEKLVHSRELQGYYALTENMLLI